MKFLEWINSFFNLSPYGSQNDENITIKSITTKLTKVSPPKKPHKTKNKQRKSKEKTQQPKEVQGTRQRHDKKLPKKTNRLSSNIKRRNAKTKSLKKPNTSRTKV